MEKKTTTRGRPKLENREHKIPLSNLAEQALKGESFPVTYVSTKSGGMNILFNQNHYSYFYKRDQNCYWRCIKHKVTKCNAKMLVNNKRLYVLDGFHNHLEIAVGATATCVPGLIIPDKERRIITTEGDFEILTLDEGNGVIKDKPKEKVNESAKKSPAGNTTTTTAATEDIKKKMKERLKQALLGNNLF